MPKINDAHVPDNEWLERFRQSREEAEAFYRESGLADLQLKHPQIMGEVIKGLLVDFMEAPGETAAVPQPDGRRVGRAFAKSMAEAWIAERQRQDQSHSQKMALMAALRQAQQDCDEEFLQACREVHSLGLLHLGGPEHIIILLPGVPERGTALWNEGLAILQSRRDMALQLIEGV